MGVSIRQVASVYPACNIPVFCSLALWAMLLALGVVDRLSGGQSTGWGPAVGMTVLCSLAALVTCKLRTQRVDEILATGTRIPATVDRYLAYRQFATVWISYRWQGESVTRKLGLTSSRRVAGLQDLGDVTLVISPVRTRWPVILELFDLAPRPRGEAPA